MRQKLTIGEQLSSFMWYKDQDKRLECEDKELVKQASIFYRYLETEVRTTCKPKKVDFNEIITERKSGNQRGNGHIEIRKK